MTGKPVLYTLLLIFLLVGIVSCQRDSQPTPLVEAVASSASSMTATREPLPSPTPTLEPPPTQTPLPSPTPTETLVPTATPTATTLPFPDEPITVDNAHLIEPLATYGKGTIWDFDLSPDGSLLAIGASTGVYFYDAQSLEEIRHVKSGLAPDVAFSADGTLLAATITSYDADDTETATVYIFGVADYEEKVSVPVEDFIYWATLSDSVVFDPIGSALIVREAERIRIWDIASGEELQNLEVGRTAMLSRSGTPRWRLALSQEGRWLTSSHTGTTRLTVWDVENNYESANLELEASPFPGPITFSPDERFLAVGFSTGTPDNTPAKVEIWNVEERELLQTLSGHRHAISALAFSPDGHLLAVGSHDGIRVWDLEEEKVVHHLDAGREPVFSYASLKFSTNGELLYSSARGQGGITVWDLETAESIASLSTFTTPIHTATFAPAGDKIALRFDDDSIHFLDLVTGQEGPVLQGGASPLSTGVAVSPDGRLLAAGVGEFRAQELIVWDLNSEEIIARIPVDYGYLSDLLFSPDGRFLLTYYDNSYTIEAELWSTSTWQSVAQHRVVRDNYDYKRQEFYFSEDGRWLIAALEERLELWNPLVPGSQQVLYEERGTRFLDVATSPDGNTVIVLLSKDSPEAPDQWLVMFELNTLTELDAIPIDGDASFFSIELLDDGQLVFLLGTSNLMLLNRDTGEKGLGQITGVRPLVSPDARLIVTGSPQYDFITVWGVPGQ